MSEKLLKTIEAAKQLGVSKQTLLKWCAEGRITYICYPSGEFRFRPSVIDVFLERHTVRARGKCPVQE